MTAARKPAKVAVPGGPRLVYVSDDMPGFQRVRRGERFAYRRPDGSALKDAEALERIRHLAIPPAYEQVWICPMADGHLQATGIDARGRKQYRYHPAWRAVRDAAKFDRMREFGRALPRLRAQVARDLRGPALSRERVVAAIVRLLDTTLVRVGNDEYARENGSFGLTTLRNRHAAVRGDTLRLSFRGKSGVRHDVTLEDPRVARLVRKCQDLPGQDLFQWVDAEGGVHAVGSADVNAYLHAATGGDFTAKDFRTWHGSAHALELLLDCSAGSATEAKRLANEALRAVAGKLGNTLAVCRKSYVHPGVVECFMGDGLAAACAKTARGVTKLPAREKRLMAFLEARA